MNSEPALISNGTERFYGKWQRKASNDCMINPDGTITYEAVKDFISPLKQLAALTKEKQKFTKEKGSMTDYKRDMNLRIYTNSISGSLLAKILIDKFQSRKDMHKVYFSIKNQRCRASVHAIVKNGRIHCAVSTTSDKLRRQLTREKREMIITIREALRLQTYVTILGNINFN